MRLQLRFTWGKSPGSLNTEHLWCDAVDRKKKALVGKLFSSDGICESEVMWKG